MKHVVIAMNHLMGLSFIRHHRLPPERSTIVCGVEEVAKRLEGLDVHDLAIHVAGDLRTIAHDTEVFQAILWLTTHH